MITFKKVKFSNFFSYGNNVTEVNFEVPGTTLIIGENLDDTTNGTGANGVGKSTMINAITYTLYDKTISDTSKGELVNNINKKNMMVSNEFSVGDDQYVVTRTRKSITGSSDVHVTKNGTDVTKDSIANTNKYIEEVLGIPYDVFVRSVVFSASLEPFLQLPSSSTSKANQSDIIEVLFGITTVSQRADALKGIMKETDHVLSVKKAELDSLARERTRHQQHVDAAALRVEQWNRHNQEHVDVLKKKLKAIDGIDFDGQIAIQEQLTAVDRVIQDQKVAKRELTTAINTLTKHVQQLESEHGALKESTCPYCEQHFAGAETKIKSISELLTEYKTELDQLAHDLDVETKKMVAASNQSESLKEQLAYDNLEELIQIRAESATISERITEMVNQSNPHIDTLEEFKNNQPDAVDYSTLNDLTKLIDHQKFLHKLLTKKDSFIRKKLLNENIPFLNQKLREYLRDLGLPHRVEFTHEMTADISAFGRSLSFGGLSAGQRARVNLALSMAFRDVLISLHSKINICILDEVLDIGLDRVGVQAAAHMLNTKAHEDGLSMFIISHRDEIESSFNRVMKVQMKGGFSNVIQ